MDGSLAGLVLAAITVLSLICWGPIPLACLWLGSRADYLTGSVALCLLASFAALFVLLFGMLSILRRLDRAWLLARRAAGHDRRCSSTPESRSATWWPEAGSSPGPQSPARVGAIE
jgi:hypothetical protein